MMLMNHFGIISQIETVAETFVVQIVKFYGVSMYRLTDVYYLILISISEWLNNH